MDYSKWDHLEVSSDEEPPKPRVTHFSEPQSVSIGADGKWIARPKPRKLLDIDLATKNGGIGPTHCWSQTKEDVCIKFALRDRSVKGTEVQVFVESVPTSLSCHGTMKDLQWRESGNQVRILVNEQPYMINELKFPVLVEDAYVYWELKSYDGLSRADFPQTVFPADQPFKVLELTLTKVQAIQSAHVWWDAVFVSDPPISTAFQERERYQASSQTFKSNYEAALKQFKHDIASSPPH